MKLCFVATFMGTVIGVMLTGEILYCNDFLCLWI